MSDTNGTVARLEAVEALLREVRDELRALVAASGEIARDLAVQRRDVDALQRSAESQGARLGAVEQEIAASKALAQGRDEGADRTRQGVAWVVALVASVVGLALLLGGIVLGRKLLP